MAAFVIDHDTHLVANESATEADVMRGKVAAAALLHLQGRDVKCLLALALQLVVVDHGILARDDLGDGVGKIDLILQAGVAFNDFRLGAFTGDNQISRMRHAAFAIAGCQEKKIIGSSTTLPLGMEMNAPSRRKPC